MAQNTVPSSASAENKATGSRDMDSHCSTHSKLRSSKQKHSETSTANTVSFNSNNQLSMSPGNVSQAVESAPARMTRKRAAHLADLEDEAKYKGLQSPACTEQAFVGSPESIGQICLCQPDPKIPRPRNGTFANVSRMRASEILLFSLRAFKLAVSISQRNTHRSNIVCSLYPLSSTPSAKHSCPAPQTPQSRNFQDCR
jgi:hypothetical protein